MQQQAVGGSDFELSMPKPVFELKRTTLQGHVSGWRLNFDRLDNSSVWCFAAQIARRVGEFGRVEGVPGSGERLADCLRRWIRTTSGVLLIVDGVLTTGEDIRHQRNGRSAIGFVVFDRSKEFGLARPSWVRALWVYGDE